MVFRKSRAMMGDRNLGHKIIYTGSRIYSMLLETISEGSFCNSITIQKTNSLINNIEYHF